jgi:hypothetical protein
VIVGVTAVGRRRSGSAKRIKVIYDMAGDLSTRRAAGRLGVIVQTDERYSFVNDSFPDSAKLAASGLDDAVRKS